MAFIQYRCIFIFQAVMVLISGTARFTKTPPSVLYARTGDTVRFHWDYLVDDRDKEFDINSPKWSFYDKHGQASTIASDDAFKGWNWTINYKTCPPRLLNPVRVRKESRATLVISNVSTLDNGVYDCSLMLISTSKYNRSQAKLVVSDQMLLNFTNITTRTRPILPPTLKSNDSKPPINQDNKASCLPLCLNQTTHQSNVTAPRYCLCENVTCQSKAEASNPTVLSVCLAIVGLSVLLNFVLIVKIKCRRSSPYQGVIKAVNTVRFGPTKREQGDAEQEENPARDIIKSSSPESCQSVATDKVTVLAIDDHPYASPDEVKSPGYSVPNTWPYQSLDLTDKLETGAKEYQCLKPRTRAAKSSEQSSCSEKPHLYEPLGCERLASIYQDLDQVLEEKKHVL